ncbi:MAG: tetratricopeptide repeat protein [Syntrophales bacterium]|nr:tetratricopeptide repeat protein [Syntrophales bacterium]
MAKSDGSVRGERVFIVVTMGLMTLIVILYGNLLGFEFINYDDPVYVTENGYVRSGLTKEGLRWAFLDTHTGYWHPVTWISHMLDSTLFGDWPGGHHGTNILLHIINTLLLFYLLWSTTADMTKSAFVAALFAVHPLNVESVAWVAERKNVLSACFFFATLVMYVVYVKRGGVARYMAVLFLFTAGLLAKPITVSVPVVMLLMDYWPLRRGFTLPVADVWKCPGRLRWWEQRLLMEKLPFFILSVALAVATLYAAHRENNLVSLQALPLSLRVTTALVSYSLYLEKLILPLNLAVFYPQPSTQPLPLVLAAIFLLALITAICVWWSRERPYLLMGWLWYVVVLFPTVGIVQTGHQALADRYAYHAFPGLFIMLSWGLPDLLRKTRLLSNRLLVLSAMAVLVFFSAVTWIQVQFWRDSIGIFQRTVAITEGNWLAHNNLGVALMERGRYGEALFHFQQVLKMESGHRDGIGEGRGRTPREERVVGRFSVFPPNLVEAYKNAAVALCGLGRYEEAKIHIDKALLLRPDDPTAHNNGGYVLAKMGRYPEAIVHFQRAVAKRPGYVDALNNLGAALAHIGHLEEAEARFRQVLRISPRDASGHFHLGLVLAGQGRYGEALYHFREVLVLNPQHGEAALQVRRLEEIKKHKEGLH